MEDKDRDALRKHWPELRKDLEVKPLLPHLVDILDVADQEKILSRNLREEQVDSLLELLPRRGPDAFNCFIKALESKQSFLASIVKEEKEMNEIKEQLNQVRVSSASMRDKIHLLSSKLELEKQNHDKTTKEMDELKNIYQQLHLQIQELQKSKSLLNQKLKQEHENKNKVIEEIENVQRQCTSLRDEIHLLSSQLELEKQNHDKTTKEMDELKSIYQQLKNKIIEEIEKVKRQCTSLRQKLVCKDETMVQTEPTKPACNGPDPDKQQTYTVIQDISKEREEVMHICEDLEKQLEGIIAKESGKRFQHRATSPMEVNGIDVSSTLIRSLPNSKQNTIALIVLLIDSKACTSCVEIEKEKDRFQLLKTQYLEEIKQLNCREAETKEKYEREKKLKDELSDQFEKWKAKAHRLEVELEKQKQNMSNVEKDFEAKKKNFIFKKKKLISETKQLKQKMEDESKMRKDNEAELEREYEEKESKLQSDISRLEKQLFDQREKMDNLTGHLEKWRTLSGRVYNYKEDFDRNGVIYALGTNFGRSSWINPGNLENPQLRVTVTRSSHNQGKPMDLLENRKGTLSCTKDEDRSWWCLDLGPRFVLFPTHYTMRHGRDNGTSILRSWNLEGSMDNEKWWTLRRHLNDRGFKGTYPFYTGTWNIKGEIRATRYFRIYQTGKNSSGRYALYLSGIELYGVLLDMG